MFRDTLTVALEASWELNPVLLEEKLWRNIDENICFNRSGLVCSRIAKKLHKGVEKQGKSRVCT